SGAVFVFRTGNGGISYTWHQTIIPPDTQAEAQFGYKVSMTDGLISISAPFDDAVLPNDQAGAVYIYRLNNNSWNFDEKISRTGLNGSQTEVHFGLDQEVQSLPTGGERLLIGAPGDFVNAAYGAAYVYEANNSTFSLVETLLASDRNVNLPDQFGATVALAGDELLVGTGLFKNWGNDPRAAYYFKQNSNQDWIELAKLKASDKHYLGDYDDYSAGIAIFNSAVIIGDPGDDDVAHENGAAYYYDVSGIPFPNTGNKIQPGTGKNLAVSQLSIYPNPNPGQFRILLSGDLKEVQSIYATDLLGRKYAMRIQNSEGWVRSEESLEKGMYLLHIEKDNQSPQVLRLLIE
ncbi:MAG: T9SS type A sorting domain-containing protein, partial [Bacteroidota bacterium]